MNNLEYFEGKVCTILTTQISFGLSLQQSTDYFVGRVDEINEMFVWLTHLPTGTKSMFPVQHIIGIIEEQVISNDHPDAEKIKEELEKQRRPVAQPVQKSPTQFIDIKNLQRQATDLKEQYSKGDKQNG